MERIDHSLPWSHLGSERRISVFRFGAGERKAYIQASLHADELPGMRCAWELKKRLSELETRGALNGVIELVRSGAVAVTRGPRALSEKVVGSEVTGR